MSAVRNKISGQAPAARTLPPLKGLVLSRCACDRGATRVRIVRDLTPVVSHKFSPGEWRSRVTDLTAELLAEGALDETRGRLSATPSGTAAVSAFLKCAISEETWPEIQDGPLIAKALGLGKLTAANMRALHRPDGLRALVLQNAFALPLRGGQTVSKLRALLAVVALERAFGNKIKTGLGSGAGFSAKAGRLLAGQLSSRPRDYGSDAKLVSSLAAEIVDARQVEPEAVRRAILRNFVSGSLSDTQPAKPASKGDVPAAANDTGKPGAGPQAVRRPSPAEFASHVHNAASSCAEGWSGNRKALISKVWAIIGKAHPGWGLSEIEFKCMLAEAHRSGLLALASADLKDKKSAQDLKASEITYKNTVWHHVRVPAEC